MSTLAALSALNTSLQLAQVISATIQNAQLAGREVSVEELKAFHDAAAAASLDTKMFLDKLEQETT